MPTETSIPNSKTLYIRLLKYAVRYWPIFLLSVISLLTFAVTNTQFLTVLRKITDEGLVAKDASKTFSLPLMLLGLLALRALSTFVSTVSMRWLGRRVVMNLRVDVFSRLMTLPVSYYDANSAGVITSKLTFDTEQMSAAGTRVAMEGIRDTFSIVAMLSYMLYLDWRLTLIVLTISPLIIFFLRKMTPKLRESGKIVQETMGEMTQLIEESVTGQRIVKIFGGSAFEQARFTQVANKNRQMYMRMVRASALNSFVVEILTGLAFALVVYYAIGQFTAGEFTAFMGAVLMLISPIKNLTSMNEVVQVGLAAAQSVFAVIDAAPEPNHGQHTIKKATGALVFEQVSMRYAQAKRLALDEVDIAIKAGEKIALVGRSGGGKTTFINALPRFYEIEAGRILMDGLNLHDIPLENLRAQFSLVSQDVVLFNDTIFNNIAYGALRNVSEAEVIAAAKAAFAWDFIAQMPQGLQSEIGDRGVRLSGGQRQRIAIARAILKNAPILLLDEATSALDMESEQHVQAALDVLMQNRTTIVIAHRLSTIENADRILVMEQGKIVESGSHATLIAQSGHYAKLYHKQFH